MDLGDDEPGVTSDAVDLDVGLVGSARAIRIWRVLVDKVTELMRSCIGIVEYGLVRNIDAEEVFHSLSTHTGTETEADGASEAQPDGMQVVMDSIEVDRRIGWTSERKLFGGEVVFTE